MKTLLCPTDFTPASENAIRYAFELNKFFNAKIILFHSYFISVPITTIQELSLDHLEPEKITLNSLEHLKEKMLRCFPATKFPLELVACEGNPLTEIESYSKNNNVDIIIMGSNKIKGKHKSLVGSNTSSTIAIVDCPVIVIPDGLSFRKINKILFITKFNKNDFTNVNRIVNFARPFNAEVIILQIANNQIDSPAQYDNIERLKEQIFEDSNYSKIKFKRVDVINNEKRILEYVEKEKADLIAITNRHKSLVEKLLNRNSVNQNSPDYITPLISLHEVRTEASSLY